MTSNSKTSPVLLALVLAAGALALVSGCNDGGTAPGSARIFWRVGGQTCERADLEWVDVELYHNPDHLPLSSLDTEQLYDVRRERCAASVVALDAVDPGYYGVKILAYPPFKVSDGVQLTRADATFEGEHEELLVRSNQEASPLSAIVLAARKGTIYLNWKFSDGMMCNVKGVTSTEVAIYDRYSNIVFQGTYACDLDDYIATLTEEELRAGFRGVKIASLDVEQLSVEVLGFGTEVANPVFKGVQEFELSHGQTRDIVVTLEPCYQGCL